jgi:hypothetical protein
VILILVSIGTVVARHSVVGGEREVSVFTSPSNMLQLFCGTVSSVEVM